MRPRLGIQTATPALAAIAAVFAVGCGGSPITHGRLENAVATTFANLVHIQVAWLGLPPVDAAFVAARATCRRPAGGTGSGDWECTLVWQSPERRTLQDTYDLFVLTNGCYTATAVGDNLGGPTLKARDGTAVRNLLYAFEGCFDLT